MKRPDERLLLAVERDIVAVAVLAAGLLFPVVAQRVLADDHDGEVLARGLTHGAAHLLGGYVPDVPAQVAKRELCFGAHGLQTLPDGRDIFLGLSESPVAQLHLIVGQRPRHQHTAVFGRSSGRMPSFSSSTIDSRAASSAVARCSSQKSVPRVFSSPT